MEKEVRSLLSPTSVVVIGASRRVGSIGHAIFSNILFSGYSGVVYPVNPSTRSILGVRCYPTVLDIPDEVELAVVVVPCTEAVSVMEDCGKKGVKGAIIISAGFAELGEEGINRQEALRVMASRYHISLIGPNCFGVINADPAIRFNATFGRVMPEPGNIAFISQSGALGAAALEYVQAQNIGISKFISVGNKADISENDLLAFLASDPQTDVILLYLEDLENPKRFIELASQITGDLPKSKPILAIKSGRTVEGAKAAASHTAALAGTDEAYEFLFEQCGVFRVNTLEELFDYATAFSTQPLPRGNRLAIITNAGGPAIIATDTAIRHGLSLPEPSPSTLKKLQSILPPTASLRNPIDLIGDAKEDRYESALRLVLEDDAIDSILVICTPHIATDSSAIAHTIVRLAKASSKPVLASFMATRDIGSTLQILDSANIPNYRFPESAVRALAYMARYAWWVHRPRTPVRLFTDIHPEIARQTLKKAREEKRHFLPEPETYRILESYGFSISPYALATSDEEAVSYAEKIGFPIVLKIVSPSIIHKVDLGGVVLNIQNSYMLRREYHYLLKRVQSAQPDAPIWGVLVQKMISGGKETILGMRKDPHFGPLLMFGLGGIYVEAFKDVTFRIAPIRELGAQRMITEIKGYSILRGFRGEPPSDIPRIVEYLERLSQLATELQDIDELDINPLLAMPEGQGAFVVDARILLTAEDKTA